MKLFFLSLCLLPSLLWASEPLHVNPDSLRQTLLEDNKSILIELNQVHQAKDTLNIARGQLLPSLNLGMVLTAAASPSFLVSSVSFLLPFLLPSNWFNLGESEHLLEAEKSAYYLLELNQYASAYTLYTTMVGDAELRDVLESEYENLKTVSDNLQARKQLSGIVNPKDLIEADAAAKFAQVKVLQMDELLAKEKAALRLALAQPLDQEIILDRVHVKPSDLEDADLQKISDLAFALAPEYAQLMALKAAGKDRRWSKVFGFLTGASLNAQSSTTTGASFSALTLGGATNIGFASFPSVQLTSDSIEQIKLREQELKLEESQIAESNARAIAAVKNQLQLSQEAEQGLADNYEATEQKYELGLTDLLHVLSAQNEVTAASVQRVSSQIDLDGLRINLNRILLAGQFASIKGCQMDTKTTKAPKNNSVLDWIFGVHNKASTVDIDKACHSAK